MGGDLLYIASVAVEKTAFCFDKLLEYILPQNLVLFAKKGSFVSVPFGRFNKLRQGVIFNIENKNQMLS